MSELVAFSSPKASESPSYKITGRSNTDNLMSCDAFHKGIWQHSAKNSSLLLHVIIRKKEEETLNTSAPPCPTPKTLS